MRASPEQELDERLQPRTAIVCCCFVSRNSFSARRSWVRIKTVSEWGSRRENHVAEFIREMMGLDESVQKAVMVAFQELDGALLPSPDSELSQVLTVILIASANQCTLR